jgi:membrane fusion protein, multidrug efflux system
MMNDSPVAPQQLAPHVPSRFFSTRRVVLGVILLLAIIGTFVLLRRRARIASEAAAAAAHAATDRVIPVLTANATRRDVPVWLEGLGSVSAFYTVTVRTLVDGRIDQLFFTEGQHVNKGDPLMQIDPRPFAIALQSADAALARDQAQLKNARLNADRYKTLTTQNLIATQQYTDQVAMVDQLVGQIAADEAQIGAAKLNLVYAHITSPIEGVAGIRLVDPGNVVHPADATGLVVVTQLDPIAVFFTLPEDDLVSIEEAMVKGTLVVEARSRDGEKLLAAGNLAVIDNQINEATATIRLKAIFANPKQVLWPNAFVKTRLKLKTIANGMVVPAAVVQHGPQGLFAYVVGTDSTVSMRPIGVETNQGDVAVISRGLQAGEEVVVEGQAQLRPGARVSTKPAASAPSAASASASTDRPAGRPETAP